MYNTSTYLVDFTSQHTVYELPIKLWQLYVEYLWNYQPETWVGKAAYTCRLLAFVLLFPFVVLTGLDVASYVIARTLGVIDDVKASTTDKATRKELSPPAIHIEAASPQTPQWSEPHSIASSTDLSSSRESMISPRLEQCIPSDNASITSTDSTSNATHLKNAEGLPSLDVSDPHPYFASEENSLKLSGVGVFSPAASQPPSPTLTRRHILPEGKNQIQNPNTSMTAIGGIKKMPEGDWDEGLTFRARAHHADRDDD